MKSALILLAYATAVWMQSLLRPFDAYRNLYRIFPYYVPETLKALLAVGVCVVVARALYGRGDHFLMRRGFRRGLLFGVATSSPMLLAFALTRGVHIQDAIGVSFLAAWYPLAEEVMSRGFAFRLLYDREKWEWWMAAGIVAAVTGAAHIEQGQTILEVLGLFAYTGVGGGIACWLLARWRSIWFPFWLHCLGNLWWEVFSVSRTALGGWFAFTAQAAMLLTAILITVKLTPTLANHPHEAQAHDDLPVDRPLQFTTVT
jgi:membrane protease YdiL (CAAX protease family)